MDKGLISIIVPVYNVENYLSACLDSILSQSYKNLEVIVIDDGSTDFSLQIAEKYAEKDDRVKVFSYENEGQSAARNHGLSASTGSYIVFVDADDIILPDSLEIMMAFLKENNADIVEGEIITGVIYKNKIKKSKIVYDVFNNKEAIEKVLYQNKMLPSPWGKLYKSELFENIRFKKGIIYEDLDIFYRIYEKATKLIYLNFPVYFYRNNEKSTINTWRPKRLDVLSVTENLENYIFEKYPDLLPAAKDRRLSANFNMFALCSINKDPENASKCWDYIKQNRQNSLMNPKVRKKNKIGIMLSYCGKKAFNLIARRIYK